MFGLFSQWCWQHAFLYPHVCLRNMYELGFWLFDGSIGYNFGCASLEKNLYKTIACKEYVFAPKKAAMCSLHEFHEDVWHLKNWGRMGQCHMYWVEAFFLGRIRGQITHVHQSHSQPQMEVMAWQPNIPYMLYISSQQQQPIPIWNQHYRLPVTSKSSSVLLGKLVFFTYTFCCKISLKGSQSSYRQKQPVLIS